MTSTHLATVEWTRSTEDFSSGRFSRAHEWTFDGGARIPASPSPHVLPAPLSEAAKVDPEEAFIAALSSCHMLFFLSIASRRGFVVDAYVDRAVGLMGKNDHGKIAMTRVTLRPLVTFSGDAPTEAQVERLHHRAHELCFLANSVKAAIVTEPVTGFRAVDERPSEEVSA